MAPPEIWGPPIWTLFHTMAATINEENNILISQVFSQIKKISSLLPCPDCSQHATRYLNRVNNTQINTKIRLIRVLFDFHNSVNARKSKPLFNFDNLVRYNNIGIILVYNRFVSVYNTNGNLKMLTETFQRTMVVQHFKKWLLSNINQFRPTPNIIPDMQIKILEENTITNA